VIVPPLEGEPPDRQDAHLVAARFPDISHARSAIEGLQSTGIDGDDIRWLSPFPERAPQPVGTTDRRITRYLLRRVLIGALVGAVAGGSIGLILGAVLVVVTAPASALGEIVALVAVAAVLGTQAGAYVGFERAGTLSDAWSTTFDELEPGNTWIGVRASDPGDRERARRALERQRPMAVREF
jgi:hypothetical protein